MIVVDAAAVVDALTGFAGTEDLRDRLAQEELHAPALLDYEVVSALASLTRRLDLTTGRAEDALSDFEELAVERWTSSDGLRRRAFHLRGNLSAYDAAYVALAEALGCSLLTRDPRLSRSAGHLVTIEVR